MRRARNSATIPKMQPSPMRSPRLVVVAALFLLPAWAGAQAFSAGTGFFIAPDGYIATCYHVVAGSNELKVRDSSGQIYAASLVLTDVANDLAVIKADVKGTPVLPVRRSSDVRKGDTVFTIGYPNIDMQGTDAKVTEGIISSIAGIGGQPNSFQISVAVQPGNSGGPLFDSSGAVVGIVSSKLAQINALKRSGSLPENVNYAVKSNYLLELVATTPMLAAKLVVVPHEAVAEGLASLVARVERATVLVIAKESDQLAPPGVPPTAVSPKHQDQSQAALPIGSPCTRTGQCAGVYICSGSPLKCQMPFSEGHACGNSWDCAGDLRCAGGRCAAP
jgi:S1-C subfamily serine protease